MEHELDLTGKKYIVTGGSSGIGKATCQYLAELGAIVIMVARNEENLQRCIKELEGRNHKYYLYDFNDVVGIENLIKKIVEDNGKLDGLVHSAGICVFMPLKNTTYQHAMETLQPNLFAFMELLRVFSLKKYNTGSGSVVGISSYEVAAGLAGLAAYAASKGGIEPLVKVAAKELRMKSIRVNCIQPGWVKTDIMNRYLENVNNDEKALAKTAGAIEPEEVARVIAFLLSDISSGINGATIPVMGKWQGGED